MTDATYYAALRENIRLQDEDNRTHTHLSAMREKYYNHQVEECGAENVDESYIAEMAMDMIEATRDMIATSPNAGNTYDLIRREAVLLFRFSALPLPANVAAYLGKKAGALVAE